MKLKKSRALFGFSLFFLGIAVSLLKTSEEVIENPEVVPNEGVGFMLFAFLMSLILAILYARKNL
jgi:hypothetical protein